MSIFRARFEKILPPWRRYQRTSLLNWGGNDGDSFKVMTRDGAQVFRLYFVDTPETSDHSWDRLGYQSRYFGISRDQAVIIGRRAKAFTRSLLAQRPFEIFHHGESVMESDRVHAFVVVELPGGRIHLLSQLLVALGLARIYTMPSDLPDGRPASVMLKHLKRLEIKARHGKQGAWGMGSPRPRAH